MISSLTNFIFGNSAEVPASALDHAAIQLKTTATEDEWLLVDASDCCCGSDSIDSVELHEEPIMSQSNVAQQSDLTIAGSPMDGSWLVTPPPCFTLGGSTTDNVASHPLENLLIEHPSMSVYLPKPIGKMEVNVHQRGNVSHASQNARVPHRVINVRTEPYNIRKHTIQAALKVKKQSTRKAYERQNKTYNIRAKCIKPLQQPSKLM